MGAMLGIVVSGNLIQIAFFWELTSLFSFLLIGYWHHNQSARDGARMALIVTGAGGVCLLVGLLLLGRMAGSYDVDAVLSAGVAIPSDTASHLGRESGWGQVVPSVVAWVGSDVIT